MDEIKFSESKLKFLDKLQSLKEGLPTIPKTESAYEGRYSYAPLDGVLKVVEPKMRNLKLWYLHEINCDKDSQMQYLTTIVFCLETGEQIVSTTSINPTASLAKMNQFMVIGSGLSYFRRYHLVTMLGLTTDEDNDAGGAPGGGKSADKAPVEVDYLGHLTKLIDAGKPKTSVMKFFNMYKSDMTKEVLHNCKSAIENKFS